MKKRTVLLLLFCCCVLGLWAQVPTTDIYLLDMKTKKGKYVIDNPVKVSDWKGYNNQPYFTPDGKDLYYVSYRNKQSDVYKYSLDTKQTGQFTNTPEDEYSPKLTPDGKYISVVRVMKDSSQQLWGFPVAGGVPEHLLSGADSIGYYAWVNNTTIVSANVPEPMKLYTSSTIIKKPEPKNILSTNTGRSLVIIKNKRADMVLYIQKPSDKKDSINWICAFSEDSKTKQIVQTLPGSEDFVAGPGNVLYMGNKGKLYKYQVDKDKTWTEIADFNNTPYKNFYRLAINAKGNKIALVSYEGKKP